MLSKLHMYALFLKVVIWPICTAKYYNYLKAIEFSFVDFVLSIEPLKQLALLEQFPAKKCTSEAPV